VAGTLADVWVSVRGKVDKLKEDVAKGGKEAGEVAGKGFASSFGTMVKAAGALFAGAAIIGFFKDTIAEQRESIRVGNLTTAVLKSTGGAAHVSAGQISGMATALSNKVGVDDEAIQTGENLLLCLEESAQALTKDRGWVHHDALSPGDLILAYDPADDSVRWEPVLSMHRYQTQTELIRWKSRTIDVATTPEHRWWTTGTSGRGPGSTARRFRTTEEITGHQYNVKIGGGVPACFPTIEKYSDDLVELAGWVATEGWFEGPANRVRLSQSQTANPKKVTQIRELMARLVEAGHTVNESSRKDRVWGTTIVTWGFSYALGRTIRDLLPGKKLTPGFLSVLTEYQANLLLDTLLDGDGCRGLNGQVVYCQKDHEQLGVVAMLAAMLGMRSSERSFGDQGVLGLVKANTLIGNNVHAVREQYDGVVWCPHLRTEIFFVRCNGKTFWTGNTFTRIRNEAGKGNDIFNQTSAAVLDMTAAMNGGIVSQDGIKTATIQLGKALNDPLKGMTALQKVGVTFSQGQKDQIANLLKHNDLLGAQKVILAEVNREFGGAAAAAADPAQKAQVAWKNFQETIGGLILPTINRLLTAFSGALPGAVSVISGALSGLAGPARTVQAALAPIAAQVGPLLAVAFRAVGAVLAWLVPLVAQFVVGVAALAQDMAARAMPVLRDLASVLGPLLGGAIKGIVTGLATFMTWINGASKPAQILKVAIEGIVAALVIYGVALGVIKVATIAWTAVQTVLDVALNANPIGLIILAIAALVAVIIWVATKTQFFQTVWSAVWSFMKAVGAWFAGPFAGFFVGLWNKLVALFNFGRAVIIAVGQDIRAKFEAVVGFFGSIPGRISAVFSAVRNFIVQHMLAAASAAKSAASNLVNGVIGFFQSLPGRAAGALSSIKGAILGALSGALGWLTHAGEQIIQGLINGIKNMAGNVAGAVKGVLDKARALLPFSPAKEGPFSGKGWTLYSGRSLMQGLAEGIRQAAPQVHAQLNATLGRIQVATTGAGAPAAGAGMTFSPTYNIPNPVDEQALARATVARLLFALNTGSG
jgi:hypothetical protein